MAGGRPLKFSKRVVQTICEAVQIGTPLSTAAVYAGVTYRSFQYWMDKGREEAERLNALIEAGEENPEPDAAKVEYFQFFLKVEEAKANAVVGWTNTINTHATDRQDPSWARYMLSKWAPELHGVETTRVELTGKDGGAIKHEDAAITDEARISRLLDLVDRARERGSGEASSGDSGTEELTG